MPLSLAKDDLNVGWGAQPPEFQAQVERPKLGILHPAAFALQQYVPLFLAKEDLDVAVSSAYRQRNATQIKLYRDKADKAEDEYNQVRAAVGG